MSCVKAALCVALCLLTVTPAWADFVALNSMRVVGTQTYTGALGMDFDVMVPILVTELGAYDSGQDGLTNAISVGIFNRQTQALVGNSATVTSANPLVGFSRFSNVSDFVLGVGEYSIVAQGFGELDWNGNSGVGAHPEMTPIIDTGGGLITFVGSGRALDDALGWRFWPPEQPRFIYPTWSDGGPANRYDAGTFMYSANVPEPATFALLGLGLVGIAASRWRRLS
jgi:hypothetical protein